MMSSFRVVPSGEAVMWSLDRTSQHDMACFDGAREDMFTVNMLRRIHH